tara:strand:+ start:64 stop:396 length:333 start_codon:yes stop_codon:yes gene_type:complete
MSTQQKFEKYLTEIEYPKKFEGWHLKGMLKKNSNKSYKFDITDIIKKDKNYYEKISSFKNKADKMVFNFKNEWVILDIEELHTYMKDNKLNDVNLYDLINNLEWNIIVKK